jgi:hypothetical protein
MLSSTILLLDHHEHNKDHDKTQIIIGELGCRILLQNFVIQHFCFEITPYHIFREICLFFASLLF